MESFIKELLEIAKECELSFDEVFIIFYDYGIVDEYGYLTILSPKIQPQLSGFKLVC